MNYIESVTTEDTGGNCPVDFVLLKNGKVLGIDGESVVLYDSMEDFWECLTVDRQSITF
jgi:hypothetical protein